MVNPTRSFSRPVRNRGFVLVAFTLALLLILGSVGLTYDIGRMYITRNESQSYCDAAAMAAVLKLDGTRNGVTAARTAAGAVAGVPGAIAKRYNFGTQGFGASQIAVRFAKYPPGSTWTTDPGNSPSGYVMAEVSTSVDVPMAFMPVLTGKLRATIGASATARQIPVTNAMEHFFPFSPLALPPGGSLGNPGTDPYGMIPARKPDGSGYQQGGIYTLRGPSNIAGIGSMCQDDATQVAVDFRNGLRSSANPNGNADRGYLWNSHAASQIRDAILGKSEGVPISIGESVVGSTQYCKDHACMVPGVKQSELDAIAQRVNPGDTDSSSASYSQYVNNETGNPNTGNSSRVVVVPMTTGECGADCPNYPPSPYAPSTIAGTKSSPNVVLGFAGFFLLTTDAYTENASGNQPICAEYIGPWVPTAAGASSGPGAFVIKLVQ